MTRLTDAVLLASIREATAAWNAEQDTAYYAEKHDVTPATILDHLAPLVAAGRVTRTKRRAWGATYYTWRAIDER
jgi:hypothetical protein